MLWGAVGWLWGAVGCCGMAVGCCRMLWGAVGCGCGVPWAVGCCGVLWGALSYRVPHKAVSPAHRPRAVPGWPPLWLRAQLKQQPQR